MNEIEAKTIAEPIVKEIVNCLARKEYKSITDYAYLNEEYSIDDLEELFSNFLTLNELSHYDAYETPHKFHPNYEYHQMTIFIYNDNSGFAVDYDLTTDGELNDLTLQIEFLYDSENKIHAYIIGAHIL